jgi:hypothetical protein
VQPALGAGTAEVGAARRLIGGRREARVAAAAARAANGHHALAGRGEIAEELAGVTIAGHRAERHAHDQIAAAGASTVAALTVLAALGVVVALVTEVEQRGEGGIGL